LQCGSDHCCSSCGWSLAPSPTTSALLQRACHELRQGGHDRSDNCCGPFQLLRREPEDLL
jgi:hypothetical protein